MKYCTHCGKELFDEAIVCPGCGCPPDTFAKAASKPNSEKNPIYLRELSDKVRTEAIIWTVVACIQLVAGFLMITASNMDLTIGGSLIIIGILNIISASADFRYSSEVLAGPPGIIAKFEPIGGLVLALIYNLIFGGVIGVVGILFGFSTRSFVMSNIKVFSAYDE